MNSPADPQIAAPGIVNPAVSAAGGDTERRMQFDRREQPTSAWSAFWPGGKRRAHRRTDEHRQPYFVDGFSLTMFVLILMLLTATIVDAVLTIQLLEAGAHEINPLMDGLLVHGHLPFLLCKYALTVAGLPFLLIFKNHYLFGTRFRVGYLIPLFVLLYVLLIGYQLVLLHHYV